MKISLFTPTNNTSRLDALYTSLKEQDHQDWEWIILLNGGVTYLHNDPRVRIFIDTTGKTNVGYLKHTACQHCTGDVLLEMDHDDLLLPGALSEVAKAFADDSVDFVYSNSVNHDIRTNTPVIYSTYFGWQHRPVEFNGMKCIESVSADPDPQSISRIWFAPNHLRAWRTGFYHRIGGHNATLKICDDLDLICRTYIDGKMVRIDKPLYFYAVHGENTWLKNAQEIETTMWAVHDTHIATMAQRWCRDQGLLAIDLCGGIDSPKGYTSVDKVKGDVTADLDYPWPFETGSVGLIRAHDAIEHLCNPIHVMNEAWRVLAHGGFFLIMVPSTDGVGAWCDPTHVSFWNWRSFRYYTEANMRKYIEHAGAVCRFQKIKVENVLHHDKIPYVQAHLIAVKEGGKRFYGELTI